MQRKYFKYSIILVILILITQYGCQNNHNDSSKEISKEYPIVTELEKYTYDKLQIHIEKISKQYPEIKVASIGESLAKRKLFLLKLGKGEKKIAVIAGVHGRESITSLLCMKLLEEYSAKQRLAEYQLRDILEQITFYFIPMLNPDGVEIAINGFSSGPRNQDFYFQANEGSNNYRRWKANGRGVDLNKQFKADWDRVKSRSEPHFESYKGPSPESETESRALAKLTRQENFSAVLAFHHSGSIIYWYYKQKDYLYQRDYKLAKKISELNNYQLIMPEESDISSAGYKDWFIKEFKKPGFTVEIGVGKTEKTLPSKQVDKYYRENQDILLELANSL